MKGTEEPRTGIFLNNQSFSQNNLQGLRQGYSLQLMIYYLLKNKNICRLFVEFNFFIGYVDFVMYLL